MSKNNPGTQARQIYRTKAQYNEGQPNQEPGKNKTGGEMCCRRNLTRTDCAAQQSLEEALKSRISGCAPKKQTREKDAAGMGGARSLRSCASSPLVALARAGHILWSEQWRRG